MVESRQVARLAVVCALPLVLTASWCDTARAQACGDATGDGATNVVDAVNVGRSAVALASSCDPTRETDTPPLPACDVDGNGTIDVIDAVNVGRLAIGLASTGSCAAEVEDFLDGVDASGGGGDGVLNFGFAPIPSGETPLVTISSTVGPSTVSPGGTEPITVAYDIAGTSAAQIAANGTRLVVAIAVMDPEFRFVPGYFELPLDAPSGEVTLDVTYSTALNTSFLFCPATRDQGLVSDYGVLPQSLDTQP